MFKKEEEKPNSKEWRDLPIDKLMGRLGHRIARIKILQMQVEELERLIKEKRRG